MSSISFRKAVLQMHAIALVWGGSALLAKLSQLSAPMLCAGRSWIALLVLTAWFKPQVVRRELTLPPPILLAVLTTGLFLGIHWIFFFHSIASGGVPIALITLASSAGIVAVVEIALGWAKASPVRLSAPVLSLAGVYAITPPGSLYSLLSNDGLTSGMLSSIFISAILLTGKALMRRGVASPTAVSFGQLLGAVAVSTPFVVHQGISIPQVSDVAVLAALGMVCTAGGQTLFNRALQAVPPGTASLIGNLEAPYGVLLAWALLGDPITLQTALGVGLVFFAAVLVGRSE